MSAAVEKVLAVAASQVGYHEVGGNDLGPDVEKYQAAVDIPPGSPWCAALVHWCLKQAGIPVEPATGDTWGIRDWAREKGILHNEDVSTPQAPVRGDIFLLLDSNGDPEHTGYVADDLGNGTFSSIEGNTTDPTGNFGGKGVYRKVRDSHDCEFVRWDALVPA